MQSHAERLLSSRIPRLPGARRRRDARELTLALQHLDDDGSPQPSWVAGHRAFTVRDLIGEPRRDEHELGGEA
jgi:hypothetical protein